MKYRNHIHQYGVTRLCAAASERDGVYPFKLHLLLSNGWRL